MRYIGRSQWNRWENTAMMGISAMATSLMMVSLVSMFTRNTETEADRVKEIFECCQEKM